MSKDFGQANPALLKDINEVLDRHEKGALSTAKTIKELKTYMIPNAPTQKCRQRNAFIQDIIATLSTKENPQS